MKLYEASNGWMGNSYIRCMVVAPDENTAREMAARAFAASPHKPFNEIDLVLLCDDLTKPWCSTVEDDGFCDAGFASISAQAKQGAT